MKSCALVALVALLALGCGTADLYPAASLQRLSRQHPGGRAFVANPELFEELEILRASGIFELVSQDETSRVIRLHPREHEFVCGNPFLLTIFTFGLMPALVPANSTFLFTVEENGIILEHRFFLAAENRISPLQYLFKPFRNDARTLSSILASEYEKSRHSRLPPN